MIDLIKGINLTPISDDKMRDFEVQCGEAINAINEGITKDDYISAFEKYKNVYVSELEKLANVYEERVKDGIDKGYFAYVYGDDGEIKCVEITKKGNRHFKREARHFLWVERWQRLKGLFKRQK